MDIVDQLERLGGLLEGHFVGTSGRHLRVYLNKDALYPHPEVVSQVGLAMAHKVAHLKPQVVAGPAIGGVLLAQWTAFHLSRLTEQPVLAVYAEKHEGQLVFRRGYERLLSGKQVVAVEDLTTTAGSLVQLIHALRAAGAEPLASVVMINRNLALSDTRPGDVDFFMLAEVAAESFAPEHCPLCQQGLAIDTQVGHGGKGTAP